MARELSTDWIKVSSKEYMQMILDRKGSFLVQHIPSGIYIKYVDLDKDSLSGCNNENDEATHLILDDYWGNS